MWSNWGAMMNMPSFLKCIIAVFFLAILPAQVNALTPGQVFNKVKDAVVVVKTLDATGKAKGQGSGVLLPSGKVATNCHVTGGGISYQVGRGKLFVPATLYAEDVDKDICLLDATGITGKPAQLGKAVGLKVGDAVYAVGAPKGLELSLSDGIVAQLRGGPPPFIQTTAAISPGSSGGGLFDGEGRLVGLTTLYIEGGQSLNFAMPVEWIGEIKPGRKTVAKDHTQATGWLKRSIALSEAKDWQGLLDWCRKWTKSEPKRGSAWHSLGRASSNLERYDDAIEAYRQALRIDPEDADAWALLGNAYRDFNRYNDAIDAFRQAIRIDPKDVFAWRSLGFIYDDLKRYDEAIDAYRQVIRIDPKNADAWKSLGGVYVNLERYDDAIEAYRQAIRIDPKDVFAWYSLGYAYGKVKRYNDAIDAFRQAIRIDPKDAGAWGALGHAYYISGNKTAALDVVRELQRLDPAKAFKLSDFFKAQEDFAKEIDKMFR
ncbi:tetratricopeptide repeat protein [bacterium]|nr:MAG: tetratricopeptide repeat protein [bacterium]